jgi:hypothetical protein
MLERRVTLGAVALCCLFGCSADEMGGPNNSNPTVGSGGGYGAIYCFALTP